MWLIILGAIAIALKFFEVKYFVDLSWWWILSPLGLAILYFEVIEPFLGLDKKKAADDYDIARKKRQKEFLNKKPPRR